MYVLASGLSILMEFPMKCKICIAAAAAAAGPFIFVLDMAAETVITVTILTVLVRFAGDSQLLCQRIFCTDGCAASFNQS